MRRITTIIAALIDVLGQMCVTKAAKTMRLEQQVNGSIRGWTCILTMSFVALTLGSATAGPPVIPVFLDDEPGLRAPMTGNLDDPLPNKTTWNFKPIEWGGEGHIQPGDNHPGPWKLEASPFSEAATTCRGNMPDADPQVLPCKNSTRRYTTGFRNGGGGAMDVNKDWVFQVSFAIENTDTAGNDELFGLDAGGEGLLKVLGANRDTSTGTPSSTLPGVGEDRYGILHGPRVDGSLQFTVIDGPITQGTVTIHYKASNQRLDFWLGDVLVLADFETRPSRYDVDFVQLGGGKVSFEDSLWDNLFIGVGAIPADANVDGVVDVADLGILGASFGMANVLFSDGDFNQDGVVDVADLGILGANWNAAQAIGDASALVPEPVTLSLLAISVLMVGRRRRA